MIVYTWSFFTDRGDFLSQVESIYLKNIFSTALPLFLLDTLFLTGELKTVRFQRKTFIYLSQDG
jgi:hypothetical protein